jgi:pyrimidine-specific ribonucleoside hydrolase
VLIIFANTIFAIISNDMKRLTLIILGIALSILSYSHPWKPSHYVIVDTDGGIDDIRAISMLLASPDVRVLAITVSPGALSAENAYLKVKSLLNSFYHEGIPVGINTGSKYKSSDFPIALQSTWGDESKVDLSKAPDCLTLIGEIFSEEKTPVSFICLGSMSTAYMAFRNIPDFRQHVKDIIWSADGSGNNPGFNYKIDEEASAKMLKQETLVKIVQKFSPGNPIFYDKALIDTIGKINTPYAKKIYGFLNSELTKSHDFSYEATDEMVPVFLHYPDLFLNRTLGFVSECTPADINGLKDGMLRILRGETVAKNQVIKELPLDPDFYFDDIKPSVNEIVNKYGIDEWTSGVLANELHRHLGVLAIIGVKMGIRAREYFDTGVDEFTATSYAGSTPPLSCMNDGIQVSTGATPGHGLLTVRNDTVTSASADFTYMNHKIKLTLKPEIADKIYAELKQINFIYGLDSNIYWELVRKNTIKYWLTLNRHDIFIIQVIR